MIKKEITFNEVLINELEYNHKFNISRIEKNLRLKRINKIYLKKLLEFERVLNTNLNSNCRSVQEKNMIKNILKYHKEIFGDFTKENKMKNG